MDHPLNANADVLPFQPRVVAATNPPAAKTVEAGRLRVTVREEEPSRVVLEIELSPPPPPDRAA